MIASELKDVWEPWPFFPFSPLFRVPPASLVPPCSDDGADGEPCFRHATSFRAMVARDLTVIPSPSLPPLYSLLSRISQPPPPGNHATCRRIPRPRPLSSHYSRCARLPFPPARALVGYLPIHQRERREGREEGPKRSAARDQQKNMLARCEDIFQTCHFSLHFKLQNIQGQE